MTSLNFKTLVTGTYYVNDQPLLVLVDCGETHSFMSTKCVKQLGFEAISLPSPVVITTATDDIVETQWVRRKCYVSLNGHEFHIDLICLPLKKFFCDIGDGLVVS